MFSVLHVANQLCQLSMHAASDDAAIDGTYVISADATDRHISVWSVKCMLMPVYAGEIL